MIAKVKVEIVFFGKSSSAHVLAIVEEDASLKYFTIFSRTLNYVLPLNLASKTTLDIVVSSFRTHECFNSELFLYQEDIVILS